MDPQRTEEIISTEWLMVIKQCHSPISATEEEEDIHPGNSAPTVRTVEEKKTMHAIVGLCSNHIRP
eukprot:8216679-Prorocentrum_lima.AAC.1